METHRIQLGDKVRDSITGFSGIVLCRMEWMYGCVRYIVQPDHLSKEGKPIEASTFDDPQLVVVKAGAKPNPTPDTPTHGDRKTATHRASPPKEGHG